MNPGLSMHEWGPLHQGWGLHKLTGWLSREFHDYRFWVIVGLIFYLMMVVGFVLLTPEGKIPDGITSPMYPYNQF